MICLLILVSLIAYIVPVVGPEGPNPDAPSSSGSSGGGGSGGGGGGGGHRQQSIDSEIRTYEQWKIQYPEKFEKLKTILWKDPITTEDYKLPTVLVYYTGNSTIVTRNQPLDITTTITNNNPLEMRRMLDLYLEVENPGSSKYERLNTWPEKIQTNEYNEKTNTTYRVWGILPSFRYLTATGLVKVRVNVSDGVNKWSSSDYKDIRPPFYRELVFNVTNSPPVMSNFTVKPSGKMRYNDPIEYDARISDAEEDMLNVTLHVCDDNGQDLKNVTQRVKGGVDIIFRANEYGLFDDADAGKNFTYYYTFDDGIDANRTGILQGPSIRKGPKLFVDRLSCISESENNYWWQWYTFGMRVKNLNPEEYDVVFTLYTSTESNPWKVVDSKKVRVGREPREVSFNMTSPFTVADANQTFSYRIKYSEYDQSGKNSIEAMGSRINPKVVPYAIYSPEMILNLFFMLLFIIGASLFIERKLKRGIEFQESFSRKSGGISSGNNKAGDSGSGEDISDKISSVFRRR